MSQVEAKLRKGPEWELLITKFKDENNAGHFGADIREFNSEFRDFKFSFERLRQVTDANAQYFRIATTENAISAGLSNYDSRGLSNFASVAANDEFALINGSSAQIAQGLGNDAIAYFSMDIVCFAANESKTRHYGFFRGTGYDNLNTTSGPYGFWRNDSCTSGPLAGLWLIDSSLEGYYPGEGFLRVYGRRGNS